MKIVVLLHTMNGVDYIGEQLQSLIKQDICEKAELKILVRDDGSTDKTQDILDRYKREGKIDYIQGKTVGKLKSFWQLLEEAEAADYYAFCEQDDVWFPEKLSRAVKYLETKAIIDGEEVDVAVSPLLYMSDFTVTNAKLKPVRFNRNKTMKCSDFEHSLIYSTMPGCTYVFNASARELMLRFDVNRISCNNYDDLARNIIYIVGDIIRDRVPTMYLRKNKSDWFYDNYYGGFLGAVKQYKALLSGKNNNVRSSMAKGLLDTYGEGMEDVGKLEALKQVSNYAEDPVAKERLLANPKFATGSFNDKLLKTAVNSKKL
ncbi:MAG: glycosyltransferase [Lachnospiraceae bacterium]|nr:glycosyltransferase [Lachnospiraceae bacterium]